MRSLLLLATALLAAATQHDLRRSRAAHKQYARTSLGARGVTKYKLIEKYQGRDFIDKWDYFHGNDPTHGSVNYLTKQDAIAKNLTYVQADGTYVLAVDDYTRLDVGQKRNSARISSKRTFNGGLFIADMWKMPHGCSTWPAYWSVGPGWPNAGEIDILEGVHEQPTNQYTLHSGPGCAFDDNNPDGSIFSGRVINTKCASADGDNSGCAIVSEDQRTYGKGFNMIGGGVIAHLWDEDAITFWQFPRGEIPQDIQSGNPDPESWGVPVARFPNTSCDINKHFRDHALVIDTTLCGDFAGATYEQRGCPGTCAEAVAEPNNFKFAKWKLNYIAVYDTD